MSKRRKGRGSNGEKVSLTDLKSLVIQFVRRNKRKSFSGRQIMRKLKIGNKVSDIRNILEQMESERLVNKLNDGRYRWAGIREVRSLSKKHTGLVDMTRRGDAYIVSEDLVEDVFISSRNLGSAMHNDLIEFEIIGRRMRGKRTGRVTNVLKRATEKFVGTLRMNKGYGIVTPTKTKIPIDILITAENLNEAEGGDEVIVEVLEWSHDQRDLLIGRVIDKMEGSEHDQEMMTILINNGFQTDFSQEAMNIVQAIPDKISEQEIRERKDFRKTWTITIDPEDAKDFDDAISLRKLDHGGYELGVHIADVTHFLKENTKLDKEAYDRSTSVYLVSKVNPMLPERLSNHLCSLNPNEDRLCFSAVFTLDENQKVSDVWLGRTVIHSDKRYTYEEAQGEIETGEGLYPEKLRLLNRFAHRLRKRNEKKGAISFESDETMFELDSQGKVLKIVPKVRQDAHLMIEQFMLLANRKVAEYMSRKETLEIPFVYRVHDLPDPDKMGDFALFSKFVGFQMNISTPKNIAISLNKLQKAAEKDPTIKALTPLAIRSMAKAEYTTANIGHFGLAFPDYTHFTSPIRRYSDVLVHRILWENLEKTKRRDKKRLETQCKYISQQERKAMDAERDSKKYKKAEYISQFIGESFVGRINGFIDSGIFVEIVDNKVEGLLSFQELDEAFDMDPSGFQIKGRSSGEILKMGDELEVVVHDVDIARREVDFILADSE
jgi:ribonuclease R